MKLEKYYMKKQAKEWIKFAQTDLQATNEEVLDQISQVYIDTRYPADFGLLPGKPSLTKVKEFLNEAESIFNQIEQIVEEYQEK